jgi:hypothetical protein
VRTVVAVVVIAGSTALVTRLSLTCAATAYADFEERRVSHE